MKCRQVQAPVATAGLILLFTINASCGSPAAPLLPALQRPAVQSVERAAPAGRKQTGPAPVRRAAARGSFPAQTAAVAAAGTYTAELRIPYCRVDGKTLYLNAFLPANRTGSAVQVPVPAMLHIHGGWWTKGAPARSVMRKSFRALTDKGIAIFSLEYRLGREGGFPENIRDCRNAVRFLRKNAARFRIDPDRIGCFGSSAGGHLSLMLGMVPEDFADGGPTQELQGISARVRCAFGVAGPTDFVRQWNESVTGKPNDAQKYHRVLFKGVTPQTPDGRALYRRMSPIGHLRRDIAPLLICDGEFDPVVPGLHGKVLNQKLQALGADSTYWMTPGGGHSWPRGRGFRKLLDEFLKRTLQLEGATARQAE